uniref:Uncharacterized protein n=1 Tax=Panagrolaimus sp. ES5 TaxID=591445 RepID=A0AC34FPJ4_9BILA
MCDPDKKFHKHLRKEDPELSVNISTLSLHIAAYENSVETTSTNSCDRENKKDLKTVVNIIATPANQNPFEFPRQQENHLIEPEVAQFTASQNLLNPNETPVKKGGRPKGSVSKKTLSAETRRENIHQRYTPSVLDTMNEQQLLYYNLELKKTEKAETEAIEERLRVQELQNQVLVLQSVINQNEGVLQDLSSRQAEWGKDLAELIIILKQKEQELKETKVEIPYGECQRYQKIQQK